MKTPVEDLEHYQMLPDSVLFDPELTGQDVRVFSYLAFIYRPKNRWGVEASHVEIATRLAISTATVRASISRLEKQGHIVVLNRKREQAGRTRSAQFYMCSNLFQMAEPLAKKRGRK